MMMSGKWRIYKRAEYDSGKAKPPPRIILKQELQKRQKQFRQHQNTLVKSKTTEVFKMTLEPDLFWSQILHAAVQYNGPILQFTEDNPFYQECYKTRS